MKYLEWAKANPAVVFVAVLLLVFIVRGGGKAPAELSVDCVKSGGTWGHHGLFPPYAYCALPGGARQ